jgi:hypothetical protein
VAVQSGLLRYDPRIDHGDVVEGRTVITLWGGDIPPEFRPDSGWLRDPTDGCCYFGT